MKLIGDLLNGGAVHTLPQTATALEAAVAMHQHRVGAILVTDAAGKPAGIFTERDLMVRVVVPGLPPDEVAIGDQMTSALFTVSPERSVSDAAQEMQARHIRHLPVVENEQVIGLLSLRDLLRELLQIKDGEVEALTAYIQGDAEGGAEAEEAAAE